MDYSQNLDELMEFLALDTEYRVQIKAVEAVLSLTGTYPGQALIVENEKVLRQLILLTQLDLSREVVLLDTVRILINLSGQDKYAEILVNISESAKAESSDKLPNHDLIGACVRTMLDRNSVTADHCAMLLSNLTRLPHLVERIIQHVAYEDWQKLVNAFVLIHQYNTKNCTLDYMSPVWSNLTQSKVFRNMLMNREAPLIQKLLPFTTYHAGLRRCGVIGALRNCSFDHEHHPWLLSEEVDILPRILLPLAGPEDFDYEDTEKLPIDLQFLPSDKKREYYPETRIMLLETLLQLCATREGREYLRSKNTYIILREYHKWETEKAALLACENVIDILIRTEVEIGMENLKLVDVPEEYVDKFEKMDQDFLKDN